MAFKVCSAGKADLSKLQIVFVPIITQFAGSEFFETKFPYPQSSTSSCMEGDSISNSKDIGLMRISMVMAPDERVSEADMREGLLDRVGVEVKTWLNSLYMTEEVDGRVDGKVSLPDVIPVIEFRQMTWNAHSINGKIQRVPYGGM